jgi:hypothetical protein
MTAHAQIQSTRPALADCPDDIPESGMSSEAASTPTDQLFREHEMDDWRDSDVSMDDLALDAGGWIVIIGVAVMVVAYVFYHARLWPFA